MSPMIGFRFAAMRPSSSGTRTTSARRMPIQTSYGLPGMSVACPRATTTP